MLITIGLGVGIVSAILSMYNQVVLQPFAFANESRLIIWRETLREIKDLYPTLPDNYKHFLVVKQNAESLESATLVRNMSFAIRIANNAPISVPGLQVTPDFFSVLGARLMLGQSFSTEQLGDRQNTAVISWILWNDRFHCNTAVIGSTVLLNGLPHTIIGVLPQSFRFPHLSEMQNTPSAFEGEYQVFTPLYPRPEDLLTDVGNFNYLAIGLMRKNISVNQVRSDLERAYDTVAHATLPGAHLAIVTTEFKSEVLGQTRASLLLICISVGAVLLVACINVVSLQISRTITAEAELALIAALGAPRRYLISRSLQELFVICIAGALVAELIAPATMILLRTFAPADFPRVSTLHPDADTMILAPLVTLLVSFLLSAYPLQAALKLSTVEAIKSGPIRQNVRARRLRQLLIGGEVAGALTLLVAAGLAKQSFTNILHQRIGFAPTDVIVSEVRLNLPRYGGVLPLGAEINATARSSRDHFIEAVLSRLSFSVGVEAASVTSVMPLTGEAGVGNFIPLGGAATIRPLLVNVRTVSPDYFKTLDLQLLEGNTFRRDSSISEHPAILSKSFALSVWPHGALVGHTFQHASEAYTIVGIVEDARINNVRTQTAAMYVPYWDFPPADTIFIVRKAHRGIDLSTTIREAIHSTDPDVALTEPRALEAKLSDSLASDRAQTWMLTFFAFAGWSLAALGVYGVISYFNAAKEKEYGIRLACGASRGDICGLIVKETLAPVVSGVLIGCALSLAFNRTLASTLYNVAPSDAAVFLKGILMITLAVLCGLVLPLWRVSHVLPTAMLREE